MKWKSGITIDLEIKRKRKRGESNTNTHWALWVCVRGWGLRGVGGGSACCSSSPHTAAGPPSVSFHPCHCPGHHGGQSVGEREVGLTGGKC